MFYLFQPLRHSKGPHILCRNPKWLSHKYPKAFLKSLNSFLLALAQPLFQPNSKLLALPPTIRPQSATGSPRALQPTAPEPSRPTHHWASTRPKPQSCGASYPGTLPTYQQSGSSPRTLEAMQETTPGPSPAYPWLAASTQGKTCQ